MILQFNHKTLRFGGDMIFIVSGTSLTGGSIQLTGTTGLPFSITIDPGDGTDKLTYPSIGTTLRLYNTGNVNINPDAGMYQCPVWSTGNKTDRIVRISCSNWAAISGISITGLFLSKPQKLNIPFNAMYRLKNLHMAQSGIYAQITEFDTGVLSLPSFTSLSIAGQYFTTDSRFYGNIQNDILNARLTTLTWTGVGTGNTATSKNKAFASTNFLAVNPITLPQLQSLTIEYSYLAGYDDSESGEGAYPDVWNTFPNLKAFSLNLGLFTRMPEKLNYLPVTLQTLNFLYSAFVKDWTDLSNLVNLVEINFTGNGQFTSSLPSWMSALTKLKRLRLTSVGANGNTTDTNWQNNFYTNLYQLVVANAPITGTSASPFRSMTISTRNADGTIVSMQLVSGTEQAPAGFMPGISNGTPASPAEMIYVLKNQYDHTIAYPA
ncbi:hypothetical protein SAMN05421788_101844 [Filimonas lacunae]|uniref:Leucine rich repeat-containing protein n=2 Tax=Filimonas lacunae TaxID=477680 RepID=A0A173MPY3_9BACT|nr:hypothetical protein FLA_5456 [Filimonas lacunae]SIS72599.1 hypothetical protein SAMN05421788_101844 [Filimonas lacunae]